MDFDSYQHEASKLAIYPKDIGLPYTVIGLAGEVGELCNKFKKCLRDGADKQAMVPELGDCLWYLAMVAQELGVSLDQVAVDNIAKLMDRKQRDTLRGNGDNR